MSVWLMGFSLPATFEDLIWLQCFISRTTFGIEEPEQFLQGMGVRGVSEEGAFPLYLGKSLVAELVEMVGKGRTWDI